MSGGVSTSCWPATNGRSGSDTAKRFPTASGSLVPPRQQSRRRGTDAIEASKKRCPALFCFEEFSCFVLGLSIGSRISDISQGFDKRSGRSRCRLGTYLRFDADIPQEMSSRMPSRPLVDLHSGQPWDQSGPVCGVNTGPQSESERRCEKNLRHMHPLPPLFVLFLVLDMLICGPLDDGGHHGGMTGKLTGASTKTIRDFPWHLRRLLSFRCSLGCGLFSLE
ncbi:hypothetical protein K456DRAFT_1193676 [Colletotrichum gloeosporioides 23]|nr:hypothetical protein K456DRAFT_1193676 [Colletotrichum gloeosporioides 23]